MWSGTRKHSWSCLAFSFLVSRVWLWEWLCWTFLDSCGLRISITTSFLLVLFMVQYNQTLVNTLRLFCRNFPCLACLAPWMTLLDYFGHVDLELTSITSFLLAFSMDSPKLSSTCQMYPPLCLALGWLFFNYSVPRTLLPDFLCVVSSMIHYGQTPGNSPPCQDDLFRVWL